MYHIFVSVMAVRRDQLMWKGSVVHVNELRRLITSG